MWQHPYTDCMCPVALVGKLDLKWAQVTFFPRVSPWWEVALEMEGLEPEPGAGASAMLSAVTALSGVE